MILADKIIENRKKNGWSQEDLAERLGVSRQSVSKWEGAQAIPDMKKILQLAEVFNVSTDYLLKDEIEETAPAPVPVDNGLEETVRSVSMEEANAFLTYNEKAASTISTGVMLCILAPVFLILMASLAEAGKIGLSEDRAALCGVAVLLVMIAAAVAMFVMTGMRGKRYEYLEHLDIDTEYGVSGMVRDRSSAYAEKHSRRLVLGIMLCVVAAIPMVLSQFLFPGESDLAEGMAGVGAVPMLILVAVGVKFIVLTCCRQGGFDRLLEEGDYTRLNKRISKYDGLYWAIATAVYLGWSFITQRWEFTWIVWPIAGVLYAAYREVLKAVVRARNS